MGDLNENSINNPAMPNDQAEDEVNNPAQRCSIHADRREHPQKDDVDPMEKLIRAKERDAERARVARGRQAR